MELRWLVWVDKNGKKSEPILQFREEDSEIWQDINVEEVKMNGVFDKAK